jgi:hypothetical protein
MIFRTAFIRLGFKLTILSPGPDAVEMEDLNYYYANYSRYAFAFHAPGQSSS